MDVKFEWKEVHEKSFNRLKTQLASADTLANFDKNAKPNIVANNSPVGLGAVLIQEQKGLRTSY